MVKNERGLPSTWSPKGDSIVLDVLEMQKYSNTSGIRVYVMQLDLHQNSAPQSSAHIKSS